MQTSQLNIRSHAGDFHVILMKSKIVYSDLRDDSKLIVAP